MCRNFCANTMYTDSTTKYKCPCRGVYKMCESMKEYVWKYERT